MNYSVKNAGTASVMAIAALLAGAYQPAAAQLAPTSGARVNVPNETDAIAAAPVAPGHVLENTYLRQGYYNALESASTFAGLDKVITVNCPKGPCSISAILAVQSGNATTLDNHLAIGFSVDGNLVDPCFAYVADTPTDGGYIVSTQNCSISNVSAGHHTLQVEYYSINGAYVYQWAATYTLYTP